MHFAFVLVVLLSRAKTVANLCHMHFAFVLVTKHVFER
jgi:hypothetical protein